MQDEEVLTPHEAAGVLHDILKTFIRQTGLPPAEAVQRFNKVAAHLGLKVRVTIEGTKAS